MNQAPEIEQRAPSRIPGGGEHVRTTIGRLLLGSTGFVAEQSAATRLGWRRSRRRQADAFDDISHPTTCGDQIVGTTIGEAQQPEKVEAEKLMKEPHEHKL
jgi:hypothetical protein